MSSLTESFFTNNLLQFPKDPKEPKEEDPKDPKKKEWFDTVYLCVQKSSSKSLVIDGFICYKFETFQQAKTYYNSKKIGNKYYNGEEYRHSFIPICKWVPKIFHKFVLNKKLQKQFWRDNISLMLKK